MKNVTVIILLLGILTLFSINGYIKVQAKTYSFTASITPTQANINQIITFNAVIKNTGESSLGSTSVTLPLGLTSVSQISILNHPAWNYTLTNSTIDLSASDGGAILSLDENITFTFDATTPSNPMVVNWNIQSTTSIQGGGLALTLEGEQPTLTVTSLPIIEPVIVASQDIINQDQTCLLTQYSGPSGGNPPYTYQWFESYNEEGFTDILGANQPEYTFSPSTKTSIGKWEFKLNVTDSSPTPQTVSSNVVNITLNSKLIAPSIIATPTQVSQSQPSTLVSSTISTGSPPYSYQWYQMVPGQDYSKVGVDSSTFSFPGSSITGTWIFLLQITDSIGKTVNSTSIELNVIETQIFSISVTQTANGEINPGTCSVNEGENRLFVISPDTGFYIKAVFVDGISVGPVASYNFVNVKSDHNIRATFGQISYSVSVSIIGNGSVTINPVKSSYYYGDTIELNAVPAFGWAFSSWTGDLVGSINFSSIIIDGNKDIMATFMLDQCMVVASAGQGGQITPSGTILLDYNQSQPFSITPNSGYHIENVLINGMLINGSSIGANNSYTISNIVGDTTIEAVFAQDTLEIVSQLSEYGLMTPSGITYVEYGDSQTFLISPSPGYLITDVLVDGNSVGVLNSYTFISVESNHTISANFAAKSPNYNYNINVSSLFGSPTPSSLVKSGESFFVSVTTPVGDSNHRWVCTGYSIDSDAPNSGNNYTFVDVQSDHNITFYWEEQFYVTVILENGLTDESGWYTKGSLISIPETDNTLITDLGMRKIFSGWIEDVDGNFSSSDQVLIDDSKIITATWKTQYRVNYNISGNTLDAAVPSQEWVDAGAQPTYEFPTIINSTDGNIRNILVNENRPNIVESSSVITGIYQTQYLVSFTQNVLDSNVSGAVILYINSSQVEAKLPACIWVNANDSISFSYISSIENEVENKKYILIDNNYTSPLPITGPITVYGNYQFQPTSSEFPLSTIILLTIIPAVPTSIIIPLFIRRKNKKKENNVVPKLDYDFALNNVQTKENMVLEGTKNSVIVKNEEFDSIEEKQNSYCPKHFGYLHSRAKDSLLPIECLSCEKMNKCIENKS